MPPQLETWGGGSSSPSCPPPPPRFLRLWILYINLNVKLVHMQYLFKSEVLHIMLISISVVSLSWKLQRASSCCNKAHSSKYVISGFFCSLKSHFLTPNTLFSTIMKWKRNREHGRRKQGAVASLDLWFTGDCRIFVQGKQNPKSVKRSLFGIS